MRLFTFPQQDASIYEEFPTQTTGLDEILEVGKTNDGIFKVRSLVQFDISTISASFASGIIPLTAQFDLILYIANAEQLQAGQALILNQVSGSWDEGTGNFNEDEIQVPDGVTWLYRRSGSLWATSGSDFFTGSLSVSLGNPITDVTFNITPYIISWVSGTILNSGVELQFESSSEARPTNWGNIKFFSKDTHTIYKPTLVTKWDDQIMSTGSLSASATTDLVVIPSSLQVAYYSNDTIRVNVAARKRYPLKTFDNQFSIYNGLNYLPSSSYFSIVDDLAGTTIIPFDAYSKLSCDADGNYFIFQVQNMYPQRYYRVLLRVDHNGTSQTFDDGYIFVVK